MIIIKSLKITDFLSHKDTFLAFNEIEKLLVSGRSGSGKSAVIESILWALYGKGRVENRNIIRKGAKIASVAIELNDDDLCYRITRKTSEKGKTGLEIMLLKSGTETELVKVEGLKEKQEWIEKSLLKSSYTLFINSIIYLQENVDTFVKQTASKRKEMLLEIANVGDYETYYARAKEELNLTMEERTRLTAVIGEKEYTLDSQTPASLEMEDLEKQHKEISEVVKTASLSLEAARKRAGEKKIVLEKIAFMEQNLEMSQKFSKKKQEDIEDRMEKIKSFKNIDRENIITMCDKLESLRVELIKEEKIASDIAEKQNRWNYTVAGKPQEIDYDGEIASLNAQIISIMRDSSKQCAIKHDHCPKLEEVSRAQIKYIENQINEKTAKSNAQKEALEAYVARLNVIGKIETPSGRHIEIANALKGLVVYESEKTRMDLADLQITYLEGEIVSLSKEYDESIKTRMAIVADLESLTKILDIGYGDSNGDDEAMFNCLLTSSMSESMIIGQRLALAKHARNIVETVSKDLIELREKNFQSIKKVESLNLIKEAFGPKGIKTLVIDNLIPRLEDKINEILGQLSDFRIRLDTQRQSADGESMVEGLWINILNDVGEEYEYDNYSGGERLKVTIAISEALASLQKCSFRIFDETFVGLDEESTEGFVAVLDQLKTNFKQVFCISHMRQIKDVFDDSIEIVREHGISRVI